MQKYIKNADKQGLPAFIYVGANVLRIFLGTLHDAVSNR